MEFPAPRLAAASRIVPSRQMGDREWRSPSGRSDAEAGRGRRGGERAIPCHDDGGAPSESERGSQMHGVEGTKGESFGDIARGSRQGGGQLDDPEGSDRAIEVT